MTQQAARPLPAEARPTWMRPSLLLFGLALLLLLLALVPFFVQMGRPAAEVVAAAEFTPTATPAGDTAPTPTSTAPPPPTATPAPVDAPSGWAPYEVQPGDTLASIAAQLEIPITELLSVNQLAIRPNQSLVGQTILVPDLLLTPEADATATPTLTPEPTATATTTPTPTPAPTSTPRPVGRFTMGFPLTMTVSSRQLVYVEVADLLAAASGEPNTPGNTPMVLGRPDVITEIQKEVHLYPELGAMLVAPAFEINAPGNQGPATPEWVSLREGSAAWTWELTALQEGRQLIAVQLYGREGDGDTPVQVHFERQAVDVLGRSGLDVLLDSPFVQAALSPLAFGLSLALGASGFFLRRKERLERPLQGLPGTQVKQLHTALLSAFPTDESLGQMVRVQLDQNLEVISTGRNLGDITYDLIRWAEANGQVERLLAGALAENPGNPALQQLAGK